MPGSIRLYVACDLARGHRVTPSAGQCHYLTRVMRRATGDDVRLFNGRDGEWRARIEPAGRDGIVLVVVDEARQHQVASDLWLLLPPLRREATEWAVEKATELGAARIDLVETARTNPARPSMARLLAIAAEAAEQSERLDVPALGATRPLWEVLAGWPGGRTLTVCAERSDAPPMAPATGPAALLVGPEGGFEAVELDALRRLPFVVPASLGPRILRAETAVVAGLALLQASSAVRAAVAEPPLA